MIGTNQARPLALVAALSLVSCIGVTVGVQEVAIAAPGKKKKKKRRRGSKKKGSKAHIYMLRGGRLKNVTIREETWARIRYKQRGSGIEKIKGEVVRRIRYLDAPPLYNSGRSQLRAGLYKKAVKSFTEVRNGAATGDWEWFYSTYYLGEAHRLNGAYVKAAEEYGRLLKKSPGHFIAPNALYGLGRALTGARSFDKAEAAFKKLDGFKPRWDAKAQLGLGDMHLAKDAPQRARKAYSLAAGRAGSDDNLRLAAKVGEGRSLIMDKQYDRAITAFDQIISTPRISPEVAGGAWVGKGDCRLARAAEANNDKDALKQALIAYLTCVSRFAGTPEAYPKALFKGAEIYKKLAVVSSGDVQKSMNQQAKHLLKELKSKCPNSPWTKQLSK